jgi:3-deoxy-D-manno-octulosonate 8-phosphate phosphatase (KDO 8-P phosphatase)
MDAIIEKAKHIRLVIFDVDGVLTNGTLTYGSNGTETRTFHAHDGMGLRLLMKTGVEVAIITARLSHVVERRIQDLGIPYFYQGYIDKLPAYDELKQKLNLADHEIAYVGDDIPDLPVIRRVGLAISVPNAVQIVKQHTHWVTEAKGGKGAAREVCDLIMQARGTYEATVNAYLDR